MKLLSIADFAERAGVTPQAIYKRIKTDLAPFLVEENGVKQLKEEGLELYKDKQPVSNPSKDPNLEEEVERLREALAVEKQANKELNAKFIELNEKLFDIIEKQLTLSNQYQLLVKQAQDNSQHFINLLNPPKEETTVEQTTPTVEQPVEQPKKKKGFLSNLFKSL